MNNAPSRVSSDRIGMVNALLFASRITRRRFNKNSTEIDQYENKICELYVLVNHNS